MVEGCRKSKQQLTDHLGNAQPLHFRKLRNDVLKLCAQLALNYTFTGVKWNQLVAQCRPKCLKELVKLVARIDREDSDKSSA